MKVQSFDDYIAFVIASMRPGSRMENFEHFLTGLIGEWGEVVELIKKHLYMGAVLDKDAFLLELGDVVWYTTALTVALGCTKPLRSAEGEDDLITELCNHGKNTNMEWSLFTFATGGLFILSDLAHSAFDKINGIDADKEKFAYLALQMLILIAVLCQKQLQCTIAEVFDRNVDKLVKRYPEIVRRLSEE